MPYKSSNCSWLRYHMVSTSNHHSGVGFLGSKGKQLTPGLRSLLSTTHLYSALRLLTPGLLQSSCKANMYIHC